MRSDGKKGALCHLRKSRSHPIWLAEDSRVCLLGLVTAFVDMDIWPLSGTASPSQSHSVLAAAQATRRHFRQYVMMEDSWAL